MTFLLTTRGGQLNLNFIVLFIYYLFFGDIALTNKKAHKLLLFFQRKKKNSRLTQASCRPETLVPLVLLQAFHIDVISTVNSTNGLSHMEGVRKSFCWARHAASMKTPTLIPAAHLLLESNSCQSGFWLALQRAWWHPSEIIAPHKSWRVFWWF